MKPLYSQSVPECAYRFAKAGLIHAKRQCSFCAGPMRIMETPFKNPPHFCVWRCL